MQNSYVRMNELLKLIPIAKSTIYQMSREGRFPKPLKLGTRVAIYDLAQVEAWVAENLK